MDLCRTGFAIRDHVLENHERPAVVNELESAFSAMSEGPIESKRGWVGGRIRLAFWDGWKLITRLIPISTGDFMFDAGRSIRLIGEIGAQPTLNFVDGTTFAFCVGFNLISGYPIDCEIA